MQVSNTVTAVEGAENPTDQELADRGITFCLLSSGGKSGSQNFKLSGLSNLIGRRDHNVLVLADKTVSGEHALVTRNDTGFFIEDLNSSNGTIINGNAVTKSPLKDGDVVEIGIYRLKVRLANLVNESGEATPEGVLEYVSGPMRGVKQRLEKSLVKLKSETETAVISRRRSGFFLSRLDGSGVPLVNDRPVGSRAICLRHDDEIELGSCRIKFRLL